jgi:hypothetical protein
MRAPWLGLVSVLAFVTLSASPSAHHSFASYYHEQESVTLEGEVVAFEYRAPHAWVRFNAKDAAGATQLFGAEWANPARLGRDGITKDSIRPGDVVRITGSPGRTESEHVVHLKQISRASDGWSWRTRPRRR